MGAKRPTREEFINKRHYDRTRLTEIGKSRGYRTQQELWYYLMAVMRYNKGFNPFRVKMAMGRLTLAQTKLFADALEMTPEEYLDVFTPDLWITVGGRKLAHLSDEKKEIFKYRLNDPERYRHNKGRQSKKTNIASREIEALQEINATLEETDD